jgi:hypothetical protein
MSAETLRGMFMQMVQNIPKERITEDFIRERLRKLAEMIPVELDNDEFEVLARQIEHTCDIHMGTGATVRVPYQPWLAGRKPLIDPFYWTRYRTLLASKGLGPQVIPRIDHVTDEIVDLIDDPLKEGQWERRGLVVGHVQSGKTANYIGVICKAADAGYRVIVLLAGLHNNLRRQTQERVEEGFTGFRTALVGANAGGDIWVGVGKLNPARRPVSLTSTAGDFSAQTAAALGIHLHGLNEPVVLVVKKNMHTLRSLIDWLRHNNLPVGDRIHDSPMLLVDDEADNASINTNADAQTVTRINGLIRELLNLFNKRSYVGYTATPFANIFVDPDSTDSMIGADLFPRDFIKSLDPPSNYVGATRVFGGDGSSDMVRPIRDHHALIPASHKIDWNITALPESLRHAVRAFVVARAIRLLRGDESAHNSMLVNASRFMAIQAQLRNLLHEYIEELRQGILFAHRLSVAEAMQAKAMADLNLSWRTEYSDSEPEWEHIQLRLHDAVAPIKIVEVNTRNPTASLDYGANQAHGLNVIAVGGLSLSRGLTLEGLTVSYFLRNSIMYDTLMQMGRWFGYREGYEDLCRVFMTAEAQGWYTHIADVVEELRAEFRRMEEASLTPADFGLLVRSHPESLIVTARNKMRHAETVTRSVSLAGRLVETARLDARPDALAANRQLLEAFVERLDSRGSPSRTTTGHWLWRSVERDSAAEWINKFINHPAAVSTPRSPMLAFVLDRSDLSLDLWDVVLYSKGVDTVRFGGRGVGPRTRSCTRLAATPPALNVSGSALRLLSRGDEKEGLDDVQLAAAEAAFRLSTPSGAVRSIPDYYYRAERKRPLLMLQVIDAVVEDTHLAEPIVGYGISFPGPVDGKRREVEYVVNTVWMRQEFPEEGDEEGVDV